MKLSTQTYTEALQSHYERYFNVKGIIKSWNFGSINNLHPDFYILEIPPNKKHNMWAYLTVGMSLDLEKENLIEVVIYSSESDDSLVELLTMTASFHRKSSYLNLHHTINIGRSWIKESKCNYGYISLPYLDGPEYELFNYNEQIVHCYWLIPITLKERDFKVSYGWEELEDLFEKYQVDYINPNRTCMLNN